MTIRAEDHIPVRKRLGDIILRREPLRGDKLIGDLIGGRPAKATNDLDLEDLVREGQILRKKFDKDSACMRSFSPDELKVRVR